VQGKIFVTLFSSILPGQEEKSMTMELMALGTGNRYQKTGVGLESAWRKAQDRGALRTLVSRIINAPQGNLGIRK